jgi:hypothetical protein
VRRSVGEEETLRRREGAEREQVIQEDVQEQARKTVALRDPVSRWAWSEKKTQQRGEEE